MIDHISVGVDDVAGARKLYDPALAVLGMKMVFDHEGLAIAYGTDYPLFWVQRPDDGGKATFGNGTHICFRAKSRAMVDEFYKVAMANGAEDAGGPGLRPQYTPTYYAAFIRDASGNKIEAVCHEDE